MRHLRKGRTLGRSSPHRKAMFRNLASSLILTERDAEFDDNAPKVKGRVVTTLHKAKEVRPLIEKCITIARKSLQHSRAAEQYATTADRDSEEWKQWRKSEKWQQWANTISPALAARRRALQLLGDKQAVSILFEELAPRFEDRPGGYTRIMKLARPRLGDAGIQAILEFVGVRDRKAEKSEKPSFGDDEGETAATPTEEPAAEEESVEDTPVESPVAEDSSDEGGAEEKKEE